MPSALYELRRQAGYRNTDDFARDMNMNPNTYKRYEFTPDKIPIPVAWTLADRFDTSIDVIVGRTPISENNSIELLEENLSSDNQRLLNDFLDFITARQKIENQNYARTQKRRYEQIAKNFENAFLAEAAQDLDQKSLIFLGTDKQIKQAFFEYVLKELSIIRVKQIEQYAHGKIDGFIEAGGDRTGIPEAGIDPTDEDFDELITRYFYKQAVEHIDEEQGTIDEEVAKIMVAYERLHPAPVSNKARVENYIMNLTTSED